MKIKFFVATAISSVFISNSAIAEGYNLFNPTPDHKLRPLNSERPSKSDFVTTVDAGRVQIETSLVSVIKDKDCDSGSCTKTSQTTLGDTTNIRLGLTENSDIQIITNPYSYKRTTSDGDLTKQDGFGDATVRFKYSFSGNKSEKFGIAVIPFVKLPTNQNELGNNDVEGGIGVPFVFNFDGGWSLGGMSQLNFLKDQDSDKSSYRHSYYNGYANALYVGKSFTDKFSGVVEYYTYKGDISGSSWQNTADFILQYLVTSNFKIDAGVNFGVTDEAADLNYYTGFTYRF